MHDYRDVSRLSERVMHKYMQFEKRARCYGTDKPLTQAEIHSIVIIGEKPDINVTELAKLRGVTKGAASQMIYKLVEKGFVSKHVSPNSDTEVCLNLTKDGKIAFCVHQEYHEESGSEFMKMLNDMPQEYQDYMITFLKGCESFLDRKLNTKEKKG